MAPATRAPEPARRRPATPTDVSAAIAERRRLERRRRRLAVAVAVGLLLLALVAVWLVRFSPVLAARHVEVQGARRVSQEQVVRAAAVPMGTPLARVDVESVGRRVAEGLTPVEKVEVRTRPPSTVVVEVTERTAVFQRRSGPNHQLVDSHGVVFASQTDPVEGLAVARTSTVDNRLLADVATVVGSLSPAVAKQVDSVQADSADQIELQLDEGRRVVWGSSSASREKVRVLEVLLGQQAQVYDVSSPGTPSTR